MLSERLRTVLKAIFGLLPVFYAGAVIAVLPNSLQWGIVIGVALVTLLVLVIWMDWPLETIWPVFPALILIAAGILALQFGAPVFGPLASALDELLLLFGIAAMYLMWAARSTWRAMQI